MIGANEIIFCPAQMMEAVEHFLNVQMFSELHQVKVVKVEQVGNSQYSTEFKITIEPKSKPKDQSK